MYFRGGNFIPCETMIDFFRVFNILARRSVVIFLFETKHIPHVAFYDFSHHVELFCTRYSSFFGGCRGVVMIPIMHITKPAVFFVHFYIYILVHTYGKSTLYVFCHIRTIRVCTVHQDIEISTISTISTINDINDIPQEQKDVRSFEYNLCTVHTALEPGPKRGSRARKN